MSCELFVFLEKLLPIIGPSLTVIQNIVLITTGIVGSVIGIKGYSTWRVQMEGKDLYSLKKKLMAGLIDYRDGLEQTRNPFLQYTLGADEDKIDAQAKIYNERLGKLHEARLSLELASKELQIIKGTVYGQWFDGIWKWYAEVNVAIEMHFERMRRGEYQNGQLHDSVKELVKEQREAMYARTTNDEFRDSFEKVFKELEEKIRSLK